jgi:hypothetical protein
MSLLLDFYAGDPARIGQAFSDDPDSLPTGDHHADFSLHLSPIDLELLTAEIQKAVGSGPASLMDSLEAQVGGDGAESSADVVAPAWVQMVAALPQEQLEGLLSAWSLAIAREHGGAEMEVTDDMRSAVRGLVRLCGLAQADATAVIHTWSM